MKKARYIIEKYCDKYHSLFQAIQIDLFKNEQSNGKELIFLRETINPNLTDLYERLWLDENCKVIKRELFEDEEKNVLLGKMN